MNVHVQFQVRINIYKINNKRVKLAETGEGRDWTCV